MRAGASVVGLLLMLLGLSSGVWAGDLRGVVSTGVAELGLRDVLPVVVYLERPPGAPSPARELAGETLRQKNASFSPPFLTVALGQEVDMPNEDAIYHNAFSLSAPNEFDLGLYGAGVSRKIRFEHPGVVRVYCSIHESMNATLFVAPTPWFAVLREGDGHFVIDGVPAGTWLLRTWSEKLPPTERRIEVGSDGPPLEITLVDAPQP